MIQIKNANDFEKRFEKYLRGDISYEELHTLETEVEVLTPDEFQERVEKNKTVNHADSTHK